MAQSRACISVSREVAAALAAHPEARENRSGFIERTLRHVLGMSQRSTACARCGVPIKPRNDRHVFCRDCYRKHKSEQEKASARYQARRRPVVIAAPRPRAAPPKRKRRKPPVKPRGPVTPPAPVQPIDRLALIKARASVMPRKE